MMTSTGTWLKRAICYAAAFVCVFWAAPGHAGRRQPPVTIIGSYQIQFRGALTGSGNATVTPTLVNIHGIVRDEAGNTSTFIATAIPLNNSRFVGTGTAVGRLPVQVSGRIDPPSDVLKAARFSCLFSTNQDKFGRIVGSKR